MEYKMEKTADDDNDDDEDVIIIIISNYFPWQAWMDDVRLAYFACFGMILFFPIRRKYF